MSTDEDFVVQSELRVPEAGSGALENTFRSRLHAVEGTPGFKKLEVWSDKASQESYLMVTWWTSREDFLTYMRSDDHHRSHARIPVGENRPRAVAVRQFTVVCD